MSTATITKHTAIQPALFNINDAATLSASRQRTAAYTEADRVADRKLCWSYTKQWAGAFKKNGFGPDASRERTASTEISTEDFEAAAARLAQ